MRWIFKKNKAKAIRRILKKENNIFWILNDYKEIMKKIEVASIKDIANEIKLFLTQQEQKEFENFIESIEKKIKDLQSLDFDEFKITWLKKEKIIIPVLNSEKNIEQERIELKENLDFLNMFEKLKKIITFILNGEKYFLLSDGLLIVKENENYKLLFNETKVTII
ncbi:MSC_0623 family F1-like ATPase-associated protein [Mesomycoplasma molare]|uniref:DUF2714 domain-containing protein n=1 Tax=Mesomycoplasma molare TaxID=171288 RepID=A0ABY5TV45_9BACT|nr:DUF2714 domain-containing protein [Mesomycoplasma molare]UWD34517.1 DUF2714 domain-containing protein [Mesomycoplasma molare]